MNTLKSIRLFFALTLLAGTLACSKKSGNNTNNNTPNNSSTFTYTVTTSGSNTSFTADSAFWSTGAWGTGVRAYKAGSLVFEINWAGQNNTAAGPKPLGVAVDFTYINGTDFYTPTAPDTLQVSQFVNNLMDGNFDVPITSATGPATITKVSGNFSAIAQQ
jgi:hypothetical protein